MCAMRIAGIASERGSLRLLPALLAILFGPLLMAAVATAPDVREGLWEYRTVVKIPGLPTLPQGLPALPPGIELPPGMSMPSFGPEGIASTATACITREQLVPPTNTEGQECQIRELLQQGNTVTWKADCALPQGKGRGEGRAVYSREKMTATMAMQGDFQGIPGEMTLVTDGRYLGPCTR